MSKPQIIIKEIKNETDDIWAVIKIHSERENLDVEFQLELLVRGWDSRILQSFTYLNSLQRWRKIAINNVFDFIIEENVDMKDELTFIT